MFYRLIALCVFVGLTALYSQTFEVHNVSEFRGALEDATLNGADDTIVLAAGTYKTTEDGQGTFVFQDEESHSITIKAATGLTASDVILDGDQNDRVLQIRSDDRDASAYLNSISIVNGNGGGVDSNMKLYIDKCSINHNTTNRKGGGIYSVAVLQVSNSEISYNLAQDDGGGIYADEGSIFHTSIHHNVSQDNGGGIAGYRYLKVEESEIYRNRADVGAGLGIGDSLIIRSNISSNTATRYGSALAYEDIRQNNTWLVDNIISKNSIIKNQANYSSTTGAIIDSKDLFMINNTVVDNNSSGIVNLILAGGWNSIFVNNIFDRNRGNLYSSNKAYIYNNYIDYTIIDSYSVPIKKHNIRPSEGTISFGADYQLLADDTIAVDHGMNPTDDSFIDLFSPTDYYNLTQFWLQKDYLGNPRVTNGTIDIGAYERCDMSTLVDAGEDETIMFGRPITITGSINCSDDMQVTYEWKKGERVLANTASFIYTPDSVGTDILTLTVTVEGGETATDIMRVTVTPPPNIAPIANAGTDKSVLIGESVMITGSGTDTDGSIVSYEWKKGDSVIATTASFSYTPHSAGIDILTLTVTDDDGASTPDSMRVTVTLPSNTPPTASAGIDRTVELGVSVWITGIGVDIDGSIVSYEWKKGDSIIATTASFIYTPDRTGTDILTLTVTDDDGASTPDSMRVTVTSPSNIAPTANAGPDRTIELGGSIQITGAGVDIDGSIVSYEWKKGDSIIATTASFSYTPQSAGADILTLTVTDDDGASTPDSMRVTVAPVSNISPTVNAGPDRAVELGKSVWITGVGVDIDGSIVSYEWKKGDSVIGTTESFIYVPDRTGTDTLTLTVTDDGGASTPDSMNIRVYAELPVNTPATTDALAQKVQALYVAFYNRASDKAGLDYWYGSISSGEQTLAQLAEGFAMHPKFQEEYGDMNNREFVVAIYINMLGNAPDAVGLNYWKKELDRGMSRSSFIATFIKAVFDTDLDKMLRDGDLSQYDYQNAVIRRDMLINKSVVSIEFVHHLGDGTNVGGGDLNQDPAYRASIKILSGVSDEANTKECAIRFMDLYATGNGTQGIGAINGMNIFANCVGE